MLRWERPGEEQLGGGSVGEQELSSEMPHPSGDAKRQLEMFRARDRGAGWGYECELPAYREY